jgi:hypothetical protein
MARTYASFDLVQLPRLTAEETLALARELETEAKAAGKLPEPVREALEGLVATRAVLGDELLRRHRTAEGASVDPANAREADRRLDHAWGALRDWLSAWGRLEGEPQAERARGVEARVFPDGLTFLTKPYKAEWSESEMRLSLLKREKLEGAIEGLGGAPFLRSVQRAHRAYGEALHITTSRPEPAETADVRSALDATHDALRDYLVQVAAIRRRSKPATVELADRLTRPVTRWSSGGRGPKKATDEPSPAPAPPPVGPSDL